ncbi:selenite/tellurite reduction operon protein ExtJ [Thiovibrio sp. JS02]
MKKQLIATLLALAFVAGTAAVSVAGKCTVTAVEGDKVTVDCDGTISQVEGTAKVGDKVTVKDGKIEAKKKKAIEGC